MVGRPQMEPFLFGVIAMWLQYGAGFALYLTNFPERAFPDKLALVGTSHQLFHLFVVSAAATWWWTLHRVYQQLPA